MYFILLEPPTEILQTASDCKIKYIKKSIFFIFLYAIHFIIDIVFCVFRRLSVCLIFPLPPPYICMRISIWRFSQCRLVSSPNNNNNNNNHWKLHEHACVRAAGVRVFECKLQLIINRMTFLRRSFVFPLLLLLLLILPYTHATINLSPRVAEMLMSQKISGSTFFPGALKTPGKTMQLLLPSGRPVRIVTF